MEFLIETERLILRQIQPADESGMFALDADPEVHQYLGNKPVKSLSETRQMIAFIRKQYEENGIGRWAVIEKETNDFIGWAGLKLVTETINNHTNYYDLGYRLRSAYWGKGYATEAAKASLDYGFNTLKLQEVFALVDTRNLASKNVLEKVGLKHIENFDLEGRPHFWLKVSKQ